MLDGATLLLESQKPPKNAKHPKVNLKNTTYIKRIKTTRRNEELQKVWIEFGCVSFQLRFCQASGTLLNNQLYWKHL